MLHSVQQIRSNIQLVPVAPFTREGVVTLRCTPDNVCGDGEEALILVIWRTELSHALYKTSLRQYAFITAYTEHKVTNTTAA